MPFDRATYWKNYQEKNRGRWTLKRTAIKPKVTTEDAEKPVKKPAKINKVGASGSLGRLIQQAVTVFHKWIRERDRVGDYFVCISCGKEKHVREMQAGHYLPAGNNGVIRFHEWNVSAQCVTCNCELHGNQENYRIGLTAKIGLENVEALETMAKAPHKWNREELAGIIERYRV